MNNYTVGASAGSGTNGDTTYNGTSGATIDNVFGCAITNTSTTGANTTKHKMPTVTLVRITRPTPLPFRPKKEKYQTKLTV